MAIGYSMNLNPTILKILLDYKIDFIFRTR